METSLKILEKQIKNLFKGLSTDERVKTLNSLREILHLLSPFKNEPVDFVKWVKASSVEANDYNPNSVAPPEMRLLELSILSDGYTQPIVSWPNGSKLIVVDGFHRNRVGKECKVVRDRILNYLPVVEIRKSQKGKDDRIASTIRHNRARGKHAVSAMTDIVLELKKRNWSEIRIGKELGMDEDEILRLCQISGLAEAFENEDFSKAWESAIHDSSEISGIEFEQPPNE